MEAETVRGWIEWRGALRPSGQGKRVSYARRLSLAAGMVSAATIAALLLYVAALTRAAGLTPPLILAIAVGTGSLVALLLRLMLTRQDAELRRVVAYTEALSGETEQTRPPMFEASLAFEDVVVAVNRTVGNLRRKMERTDLQQRELEVEARLAKAQHRQTQVIFDSLTDAVLVTNAFNEIVLINDAAKRLLGVQADPSERQPIERSLNNPALIKLIKDARAAADPTLRRQVEHTLPQHDRERVFSVTLAGLNGPRPGENETGGVITILRDITNEKAISERKSEFFSHISHELRTPLSSIKAYMEMLVDGEAADDETRAKFYNIIQGETNRLSRLIDNILSQAGEAR